MTGNAPDIDAENEFELKRELLRRRNISKGEAQRIANITGQKDPGDRYERKVVPVSIEDEKVKIGSVRRIAGNENVRWKGKVVGTFGAAGETREEVKQAFRDAKSKWIKGLHDDEQIAREFDELN